MNWISFESNLEVKEREVFAACSEGEGLQEGRL